MTPERIAELWQFVDTVKDLLKDNPNDDDQRMVDDYEEMLYEIGALSLARDFSI